MSTTNEATHEHSNVQQGALAEQRVQDRPRESVQTSVPTYDYRDVDTVTVCDSWWHTRSKLGVHVLNPSKDKLTLAKQLAKRMKTYTVYVYKTMPKKK